MATSAPTLPLLDVDNPATGETVATIEQVGADAVAPAAERARAAQVRWAARPWRERAAVVRRFHDLALDRSDLVLDTIQSESGKSRRDALAELITVAGTARYYLAHGRHHLSDRRARPGVPLLTRARSAWQPHGLVGLITPWNFPFLLGVADALPALLAGNAVLTKPSELTPLSTLLARDLLVEAGLDPDLFQPLVGAGPELGGPLVAAVDYVGFTGSTATGRIVARAAADRLIPCSLELGGKNPMLVMPGARIEDAVHGLVAGGFANSGQTCISVERIYVHDDVWDEFVAGARARVGALRVGWSEGFDVEMGSLVSVDHADKVRAHIADARERGAEILVGGDEPPPGLGRAFVTPTIVTGTDETMAIHSEETFGPVVRLERVASAEEAIAKANDSDLGLNGSVWAGGRRGARGLARRLAVGTANVNSTLLIYNSYDVPMGGIRRSGIGRRHAAAGIQRYCRQQSIVESFSRGGGYEIILRLVDTPKRTAALLRVVRLWRRVPGMR
ncbi:MAG: aldehyde dehydrogenase [Thermoleophilia bacterium]|nr:aldehyde dehydrogenase [Thermoleophilia bacterium]